MFLDPGQVELEEEVSEADHRHLVKMINFGWAPLDCIGVFNLP